MRGTITSRHVVLYAFTIIRLWGLRTYLRCLHAAITNKKTTFLSVLCCAGCSGSARGRHS